MLPNSVEALAKIKVTFLHAPDVRSLAVSCRLVSSVGAAMAKPVRVRKVMSEAFMLDDDWKEKESVYNGTDTRDRNLVSLFFFNVWGLN
jgi:hypothetical protein